MRAPLVPATLLVAAGILLGLFRPVLEGGGPLVYPAMGVAVGVLLFSLRGRPLPPLLLVVLLVSSGALLGTSARRSVDADCTTRMPPDITLKVEGVVESVAEPRLRLRLERVAAGSLVLTCDDVVSARFRGQAPPAGTRVAGQGRWWTPDAPSGLRVTGALMLDGLSPEEGAGVDGTRLAAVRGAAARRLEALYGPRAPLANSLLLAQRDGVDPEVRDRFARSGLSHLLAISGLHVGLVAGLLILLGRLARLSSGRTALAAGLGTAAYVLFLGAPASASRAALQVILLLVAGSVQRPARSEAVVAAAALVLLAWRPGSLLEPGFQLSFAGVAGILALRRPLLSRLGFLTGWRPAGVAAGKWLADGLATGVAATLATGPIVAWHFGQVAPVGVVANLAAIPLVAALVPVLALSLAVGSVWEAAGLFLAGTGQALLNVLEGVATVAAGLPGAGVGVSPGDTLTWTAAGLVAVAASRGGGRIRGWLRGAVAVGVGVAALVLAPVRPGSNALEVHMIDVGQGDAVALRTPANRWFLVDAGMGGDGFDAGASRVVPYLSLRGVRRLEGLVLTHPHADHFGGAAAVAQAFRPRWIGDPGRAAPNPGYLDLLELARRRGTAWLALRDGAELRVDGVLVEFLHPFEGHTPREDPNDDSVVMRVSYGEFSVLLTGDASADVEAALVSRVGRHLESEVLKVGHHGSSTSTTAALLEATGARVALVSAGRRNRYGHPHADVLARLDSVGARVLRTDRHGNVVVLGRSNGEWTVRSDRGSQ